MPKKGPNLKSGQRYEFVCLQIDIAGHSRLKDADRTLHEAKERFHKLVTGLVESHDGLPFKWEGDGGAFLFPSADSRVFDESVHAAFDILDALPRINDQLQIAHQLSQPLSVRVSLDMGMAVYNRNPGLITGDFLNAFLKHERAVSLVDEVTITQRIHRQLAAPLRKRFTEYKHSEELGCQIYRSSQARTGTGLSAASDATVPASRAVSSTQEPDIKSRKSLVEGLGRLAPSDFLTLLAMIPRAALLCQPPGDSPRAYRRTHPLGRKPHGLRASHGRGGTRKFSPGPVACKAGDRGGRAPIDILATQVKSAKTLVELAWCIGKAVQAGYELQQADRACNRYVEGLRT